jgi:hypothetical protein
MRATRLSVANYNTTLSSDSLESGTGSSNSLRRVTANRYPVVASFRRVESDPSLHFTCLQGIHAPVLLLRFAAHSPSFLTLSGYAGEIKPVRNHARIARNDATDRDGREPCARARRRSVSVLRTAGPAPESERSHMRRIVRRGAGRQQARSDSSPLASAEWQWHSKDRC